MGYVFGVNERTFWSPSLTVGRLVLSQVQSLESLVETASGFNLTMSDTVDIDVPQLQVFVAELFGSRRLENDIIRSCLSGVISILLAVLICHDALPDNMKKDIDKDILERAAGLAKRQMRSE